MEGDDGLKLSLMDRFGRFIGQAGAEDEYLRLLLHVLSLHRTVARLFDGLLLVLLRRQQLLLLG